MSCMLRVRRRRELRLDWTSLRLRSCDRSKFLGSTRPRQHTRCSSTCSSEVVVKLTAAGSTLKRFLVGSQGEEEEEDTT